MTNTKMRSLLAGGLLVLAGMTGALAQVETRDPSPALMSWADLTSRPLPQPTQTLRVGPLAANEVDLWLPNGEGPFPVVLMVHGGCWQKSIADRTLMNYAAKALSEKGFAVWNIEYRGVDEPGGGYPGTFLDVSLAADTLRSAATDFNLDLSRLVAYGHSAGGHLALWLASREELPDGSPLAAENPINIPAVVNAGGLADLESSSPVTLRSCLADIEKTLTGRPSSERPDVYADTSPASMLPIASRQISINAERDAIAPPKLGRDYTEKAIRAKDPAAFVLTQGGHVELIAPGTIAFDDTIALIEKLSNPAN